MDRYHRPVIPLLFSFAAGIVLSALFQGHAMAAFAVIGLCFCFIAWAIMAQRPSALAPILLFVALGYVSIHPWLYPEFPPHHMVRFADGKPKKITGVIEQITPGVKRGKKSEYRASFILKAETIEQKIAPENKGKNREKNRGETGAKNVKIPVSGRIRATLYHGVGPFSTGDRVSFDGKLFQIRNFENPGGFDYKRHMAFKKIWVSSYVSSRKMTLEKKGTHSGAGAVIESFRQKIARFIDRAAPPEGKGTGEGEGEGEGKGEGKKKEKGEGKAPDAEVAADAMKSAAVRGILRALVTGDRSQITPHVREVFNRSGAGHLLAISGLHIGIIAALSFFLFTWAIGFIRPVAMAGGVRKTAAVLSLFPVMAYAAISGLSPSTQRAAIMTALFLISLPTGRLHESFNTLALAAFVMLIIAPHSLFSVSFRLSFAAVFSILWGFEKIKQAPPKLEPREREPRHGSDPPKWFHAPLNHVRLKWLPKLSRAFYATFFISMCAIIGTLPFSMFYFNQVSLAGIVANLFIVPAVGFIAIPLGLFSAALNLCGLFGADFFLAAALFVLTWAFDALEYLSGFSFAAIKTVGLSYFEIVCYYALAISGAHLFSIYKNGKKIGAEKTAGDGKKYKKAAFFFAAAALISCADVAFWVYDRFINPNLRVTFLDVGQGNAALIEFPKGFRAIVDGGGMRSTSDFDTGKNIVAPFLWRKKIKTIDAMFLSHPDNDHVNGLVYIASHFNVKSIWTNHEKSGSMAYKKLMRIAREKNIPTPDFKRVSQTRTIHGVTLETLYPPVDFLKRKKTEKWRDTNNNSLVIKVSLANASILFSGDIMKKGEQELLRLTRGNGPNNKGPANKGTAKKGPNSKETKNRLKSSILLAPHHGSKTSSSPDFLNAVAPEAIVISSGRKYGKDFPHAQTMETYKKQGAAIFRTDTHGAVQVATHGKTMALRVRNQGQTKWGLPPINRIKEAFGLCF